MFLNTFHERSFSINDVVKSYHEKTVLKTLQLEFRLHLQIFSRWTRFHTIRYLYHDPKSQAATNITLAPLTGENTIKWPLVCVLLTTFSIHGLFLSVAIFVHSRFTVNILWLEHSPGLARRKVGKSLTKQGLMCLAQGHTQ